MTQLAMKVQVIIALIALVRCYTAVSSSSSMVRDESKRSDFNKTLLQAAELYLLTRQCEISLPQKTSLVCRAKRFLVLTKMKKKWDLEESYGGFALLDSPGKWAFLATAFKDPFRRFNLEGYVQTVFVSDLSKVVYESLVNSITEKEISHNYNYQILSKYFELAAKLGGEVAMRASQYEPFITDKKEWISDKYFTQQRLAGVNPMSLRRVTFHGASEEPIGLDWDKLKELLNPNFDWETAVQKVLGNGDSIAEAIIQGRVYALRYELCDDLPREPDLTDSDPRRTMWDTLSPIALFVSAPDFITKQNKLAPVAIQMDYTPESVVFTPEDEGNWMMAKLNVQVTDLAYAQIVEHLAKVHFLMEPFCVILRRTLSSRHPLYQILQYHCRDLLIPNTIGAPVLVGEGEYMDQLFAFGSNGTDRLLNDAHPLSTWNVTDFRKELKKRGVDDKDLLPYFPYRDDGEKILEVIENLVKEYVDLYYYDNQDVKNDKEFRNYLNELSTDGSFFFHGRIGKIQGLPPKISTKEELCDIVTRIISQLSLQHATVNYPLSDYAEYTPNLPTKLYNDTRLKEGEFSVLRLPNRNTSVVEVSFSNSLALYRFDTLFDYGNNLEDIKAVNLINEYYSYLMYNVQPEMQEVNEERKERGDLTYPYLIPRWIPNGIQT